MLQQAVRWILFALLTGIVVGFAGSVFAILIGLVTGLRLAYTWILFLLPVAGIPIAWMYKKAGPRAAGGTSLILEAIREERSVPAILAPIIFVSTILTHLFGGSAGREGAALQMGGSLGNLLGRVFHFRREERPRVIMCGMSAAFSALFGTPLAAAVMPLEISTTGVMYYSALLPCAIAALAARMVSGLKGLESEAMPLMYVPQMTFSGACLTAVFAILCSLVSILFCTGMHRTEHFLEQHVRNTYIRIMAGGAVIVLLTLLTGGQIYNGGGSDIIALCVLDPEFSAAWYMFLLKILFTVVTLSAGYKGGEIVPSLFIGATFGNFMAHLTGQDPAMGAVLGMACLFCGISKCPVTALLICFELFGFEAAPYLLLAVAVAFLFSGKTGIYQSQTRREA